MVCPQNRGTVLNEHPTVATGNDAVIAPTSFNRKKNESGLNVGWPVTAYPRRRPCRPRTDAFRMVSNRALRAVSVNNKKRTTACCGILLLGKSYWV